MDFFENDLQFTKIIFNDKVFLPVEVNREIHALREHLTHSIISDTPFIYLFAHNHIKTVIAYFAIIKSGHVCVLVEPDIGRLELDEMQQDTPPCALIRINRTEERFDYAAEIVFTDNNPKEFDEKELEEVCTIVYTNAEDGYAKGAMLTEKNLLSNARAGQISDEVTDRNVFCALLPFHHMFGLQTGLLTPLYSSASLVIEDLTELRRINKMARDIQTYGVTNLFSLPGIYYLLAKIKDIKAIVQEVQKICSGGCALPRSVYDHFLKITGKEIAEGYGLTEASPVAAWHRNSDPIKIGSVGRSYPCCEIRIFSPEGNCLHQGETGEIWIKGSNVMKGYYNRQKATGETIRDGWLRTGDLGMMDDGGYLFFKGLKKRMINNGGKKIYPEEVVRLLSLHRNVKEVKVVEYPKFIFTKIIKVQIELIEKGNDRATEYKDWVANQISSCKVPKELIFI
jgi:long-chain acyl-CoA synthetase